jgi:hypothetical protein
MAVVLAGWLVSGVAPAAPPPQADSDAEIERDIRERFAKSKIARNNFQVKVRNGVATLDGKTDVIQHKGVATRLAKLGGAASVNNRIQVSEAARQKASENLAKGRRRAQARRAQSARGEPRSQARGGKRLAEPKDAEPEEKGAGQKDADPKDAEPKDAEPKDTPPRRAVVRWRN